MDQLASYNIPVDGDFSVFQSRAEQFKTRILQVKRDLGPLDFEWYPHDSFSSFTHINRLLTGSNRSLFNGKKKILDLGCQDGDLSFYLESAGHEVVALDYPSYNHNCMRGVRALKEALHSSIQLREVDLDRQFLLTGDTYDVALLLGVLYHLRNPFYVLDELARRTEYCLLSTRIARCFPDGTFMPPGVALAYLLGERELNHDETNYHIFSEPGLRVLLQRTHWDLCEYITAGRTGDSDPVRPDRDERAFCLLKSRYGVLPEVEMLEGWHPPEESGWRWTQRQFSARVRWQQGYRPRVLIVDLFLSEDLMRHVSPLGLSLSINGKALTPETFRSAGTHELIRSLRGQTTNELVVSFSLSGALEPNDQDGRERGIVVSSIRVE